MLTDVWPLQVSVRAPETTSRLVDFAMAYSDVFPQMVAAVLPHVGVVNANSLSLARLMQQSAPLITLWPAELLTLLFAVLPERAEDWPYGTNGVIARLAQDPELALDDRLLELRRRWSAR